MCFHPFAASAVELNDVLHSPSAAAEWSFDRDNIFPLLHGRTLFLLINISVINLLWHKAFQLPTQPARQFDSSPKAAFHRRQDAIKQPSCGFSVSVLSVCCLPFFLSFTHLSFFFSRGLLVKSVAIPTVASDGWCRWWQPRRWRCTLALSPSLF